MSITERERATLRELEAAIDADEPVRIVRAVGEVLAAAPASVVDGEVGAVFKAIGRAARRDRIRAKAKE